MIIHNCNDNHLFSIKKEREKGFTFKICRKSNPSSENSKKERKEKLDYNTIEKVDAIGRISCQLLKVNTEASERKPTRSATMGAAAESRRLGSPRCLSSFTAATHGVLIIVISLVDNEKRYGRSKLLSSSRGFDINIGIKPADKTGRQILFVHPPPPRRSFSRRALGNGSRAVTWLANCPTLARLPDPLRHALHLFRTMLHIWDVYSHPSCEKKFR